MIHCTDSGSWEATLYGTTKKTMLGKAIILLQRALTILTLREAFWGGKKKNPQPYSASNVS